VIQKNLTIDVTPPTIDLVADDRYVNFGGVGVIVYKPSADTATSGVKIGEYFLPRLSGPDTGPSGSLHRTVRPRVQRPGRCPGLPGRH